MKIMFSVCADIRLIPRNVVLIAEETMEHLNRKNYYIGKTTIETYNYYKNKLKGE